MDSASCCYSTYTTNRQDLLWYRVRDTLLGRNSVQQSIELALELSATCKHPDAVWLTQLFVGKCVSSKEDARAVLLEEGKCDIQAMSFAALIEFPWSPDVLRLQRAATAGHAFAQAWCAGQAIHPTERFKFASQAVQQYERDGFYELGHCYQFAIGCSQDLVKAKENFMVASKLGHVKAMVSCGHILDSLDPQRFFYLGLAAARGCTEPFLSELRDQLNVFESSSAYSSSSMFAIGKALSGHVCVEKKELFGERVPRALVVGGKRAVKFYSVQWRISRQIVDTWTLVGLRNGVVKDIRIQIGKIIWEDNNQSCVVQRRACVIQ